MISPSSERIAFSGRIATTTFPLNEGDEVKIKILDYFIFEDDGKDQIKIMT